MKKINLNKYLLRQKIIFNEFIESNGKETSLIPFQKSFAIEDGVNEYSYIEIKNYLLSYVKGNNITKKELEAYKKTKQINCKTVFIRGFEITITYITSLGNINKLESLLKKYSQEDGKIKTYSKGHIKSYMEYYKNKVSLNNLSGHTDIVKLCDFIKNKIDKKEEVYSDDFFDMLYNTKSMNEAVRLLHLTSLTKDEYLYNINKCVLSKDKKEYLLRLSDLTYQNDIKKEHKEKHEEKKEKPIKLYKNLRCIDKFKRVLERLINKPLELNFALKENDMLLKTFKEYMNFDFSKDNIEIANLINDYKEKLEIAENKLKPKLELLVQGLTQGVPYNGKFRVFNLYDYYSILGENIDPEVIFDYLTNIYRPGISALLMHHFSDFYHGKSYIDSEEAATTYINSHFIDVSYEQVFSCAEYILSEGWVLNMYTLKDTLARVKSNDIEIPIINRKMNKN